MRVFLLTWACTLCITCGGPFPVSGKESDIAAALVISSNVAAGASALSSSRRNNCADPSRCLVFKSSTGTMGSTGGIAGADSICNASGNRPNTSSYKALIVDEVPNRRASLSANAGDAQIDWVLIADQDYYRTDGTFLFRTGTNRLFTFPLPAYLSTLAGSVWTGLNTNWTTFATLTCSNWTVTTGNGRMGTPSTNLTVSSISAGSGACNIGGYSLLCIEQ